MGAGEHRSGDQAEAAEDRAAEAGERVLGGPAGDLLEEAHPLGDHRRGLGDRLQDLRHPAHQLAGQVGGLELVEEDLVRVLPGDHRHIQARFQDLAHPLEGHQGLDHEDHLDGEVHAVLGPLVDREEDELGEREITEVGTLVPALEDLGDLTAEPHRVGPRPGLGDGGQNSRRRSRRRP